MSYLKAWRCICSSKAFSLIEVMIFVTLFSIIFVAIATYISNFLRATQMQEHRLIASHYADDLMEWLRGEKDTDWNNLVDKSKQPIYCFNDPIPVDPKVLFPWKVGDCAGYSTIATDTVQIQKIYKRTLLLESVTPSAGQPVSQIRVRVQVEWMEGSKLQKSTLSSVFSVWKE